MPIDLRHIIDDIANQAETPKMPTVGSRLPKPPRALLIRRPGLRVALRNGRKN